MPLDGALQLLLIHTLIVLDGPQLALVELTRLFSGATQGVVREATQNGLDKQPILYAFQGSRNQTHQVSAGTPAGTLMGSVLG